MNKSKIAFGIIILLCLILLYLVQNDDLPKYLYYSIGSIIITSLYGFFHKRKDSRTGGQANIEEDIAVLYKETNSMIDKAQSQITEITDEIKRIVYAELDRIDGNRNFSHIKEAKKIIESELNSMTERSVIIELLDQDLTMEKLTKKLTDELSIHYDLGNGINYEYRKVLSELDKIRKILDELKPKITKNAEKYIDLTENTGYISVNVESYYDFEKRKKLQKEADDMFADFLEDSDSDDD